IPNLFICPSSPTTPPVNGVVDPSEPPTPGLRLDRGWSNYSGVNGSGASSEGIWDLTNTFFGDVYVDGVFYPESRTEFAHVTDGSSQTFALGERVYVVTEFDPFLEGAAWAGPPGPTKRIDEVKSISTKNVRFPINGDPNLFGYYAADKSAPDGASKTLKINDFYFGSHHPGGAHFALVDGSTHFFADDIDINLYKDLATRNGGEVPEGSF
ncbi:MAG: DUF1559 domain-containing protein, partial [Planctomycetota bacterium]